MTIKRQSSSRKARSLIRLKSIASQLIEAARTLRAAVARLEFGPPVTHVYNPLAYGWRAHAAYVGRYANSRKRVLFLGMNPGPFGMAQTGVPFGEVNAVKDWLQIKAPVGRPAREHPRRRVLGFACPRSEVSGRRLWNLFAGRYPRTEDFFAEHFVANYCPLAFFESSGRNRTPDKLPRLELAPLLAACDEHLRQLVEVLRPEWVIGVGRFAETRARAVLSAGPVLRTVTKVLRTVTKIGSIPHPRPANAAANRVWSSTATARLNELGVWRDSH